jgi:hypothetical protein
MIKSLVLFALALLLGYSMSAFVQWDYNPGNWTETARFVTAMIFLPVAAMLAAANYTKMKFV